MKRFLTLFLACVLVLSTLSLFGCSGESSDSFKIGAIYITSQNDTAGYTYAHHNGITKAMEALGLSKNDLYIIDNVLEDDTAVGNAIDTLAGKGCDIIFGISFGYLNAFDKAAKKEEYKDIVFSHATGYLSNEKNFNNYFGRIYQARYLAGIAAGLKSLELGNNNLGYVAAYGTEYAETCSGINAFLLGAQSVNPNAVLTVKKLNNWADEINEKAYAEVLIETDGCCVIAQHCDSAQPQKAAEAKDAFGCGYNSDMTKDAPDAHLTAPIWNWDVYYKLAIETAMNDKANFMTKVGNYYGGLKEGFVDVSPLSKNCSADTDKYIKLAKDLMISGEWDVFSGVKLSFNKAEDGTISIVKTDADLVDSTGNVIVAAGGASVADGVIQGSMNYYVAGVTEK